MLLKFYYQITEIISCIHVLAPIIPTYAVTNVNNVNIVIIAFLLIFGLLSLLMH